MRVRYVHRGYFPARAGAELMMQYLAEGMARRGLDVRLHAGRLDEDSARFMAGVGVRTEPLPRAADLAGADRPDVVHAFDAFHPEDLRAGLELARAWDVPFAVTPASAPGVWPDREAVLDACRAADAVFVLTGAERDMLAGEGVRPESLHLVAQGPHLPGTPDPERFRRAHGITGPMVLFLGRKMRSKGYTVLLEAARAIWERHPETRLVFVGPRWDEDCLEQFAAHADPRVIELGLVDEDDKHSALEACDLVCLPSTVDVFPLVYAEAWACSKPVIGSDFAGSEEVVRHGRDGLLVAAAPGPVAGAVVRLLDDPAERIRMGQQGNEKLRRELTWDAVTDRVHEVYTALVSAQRHKEGAR
ncbi:glycosyltransferase family 4 protein [Streptomyces sp. H27-S2]|uniref:glycosyltransferase family 4 protein n=1 Tax=Streptomyces antarcticus TaxID=2996458 RepID=UPI002271CDB1|nr:glycosyltransferase family 4 protein [Streptomyces sp. H27-S2]MCY0950436.1 glycosyltransferase family 4 protein [Streptomyces sp. H27-S2]